MVKDYQIKKALGDLIKAGLDLHYDNANVLVNPKVDVNVYRRWMLYGKRGESAAILRVATGRDAGRVHTWMIGTDDISRQRSDMHGKDPLAFANTGSLKKTGPNRRDTIKSYKVWAFLEYSDGTDGTDDADSSENMLIDEIDYIAGYLSKFPTLGLTDSSIQGHTELSFSNIDVYDYGEVRANVALGTISVVLFNNFN